MVYRCSMDIAIILRQAIQQSGLDREQLWVTSKVRVQSCNSPEDVVKAGWKPGLARLGTEVDYG